jgi:hypothetical protein
VHESLIMVDHIDRALTSSQMRVDTSKQACPHTVTILLTVGNVASRAVTEFLCETKVDDVDEVRGIVRAHNKVRWFHVSMYEVVRVNVLEAGNLR